MRREGVPVEQRTWRPHLTLARLRAGAPDPDPWVAALAGRTLARPWSSHHVFLLVQSVLGAHARTYRDRAAVPLRPAVAPAADRRRLVRWRGGSAYASPCHPGRTGRPGRRRAHPGCGAVARLMTDHLEVSAEKGDAGLGALRAALLDPRPAAACGRVGAPTRSSTPVPPGGAAAGGAGGRRAAPGHRVRRDAGLHQQPRLDVHHGRGRPGGSRVDCWPRGSRTGGWTRPTRCSRCAPRVAAVCSSTGRPRPPRLPPSTAATTAPSRGCWTRAIRTSGRSASPTPRAGAAEPAGQVPAGGGVPPAAAADLDDARAAGRVHRRAPTVPLRIVDLGCGNAYLTFAAFAWLAAAGTRRAGRGRREGAGAPAQRGTGRAWAGTTRCVRRRADRLRRVGVPHPPDDDGAEAPDVVLALHACDTATDDALARAVRSVPRWCSPRRAATTTCSPSCARRLARPATARGAARHPAGALGDVLTDALRAPCCACSATASRWWSSWGPGTRRATCCMRAHRTGSPARRTCGTSTTG